MEVDVRRYSAKSQYGRTFHIQQFFTTRRGQQYPHSDIFLRLKLGANQSRLHLWAYLSYDWSFIGQDFMLFVIFIRHIGWGRHAIWVSLQSTRISQHFWDWYIFILNSLPRMSHAAKQLRMPLVSQWKGQWISPPLFTATLFYGWHRFYLPGLWAHGTFDVACNIHRNWYAGCSSRPLPL